jgi:hypothetical protein
MYFLCPLSIFRGMYLHLMQVKQEQAALERQLFQERCAIQAKHEEKVKLAQAKSVDLQRDFASG